ncbi:MAG: PepSY domain-containing protein [Acidimicrobiales bacterium]
MTISTTRSSNPAPKKTRHLGRITRSAVGVATFAAAGGGMLAAAPGAFAASSAPTHGTTTCAVAGDECSNAIAYANAHDGGGAKVLAVEADTEAHGGTVQHRVFDIRVQTNTGVDVVHVYRNDHAPYNDGVWWQSRAENQNPSGGGSSTGGSSTDTSPDTSNSHDATNPDTSPDQPASTGGSGSTGASDSPQISAAQAASDATSFVAGQGRQVLGVKHDQLKSSGQKDYYQVKLQLGENGRNSGTTNVWVDATSSPGTVTAVSGSGLNYRDAGIVSPSTAQANAVAAVGGGQVYKTNINGGKWRWYWVFVRNGGTKYKVGVAAATGQVTQVKAN